MYCLKNVSINLERFFLNLIVNIKLKKSNWFLDADINVGFKLQTTKVIAQVF